MFYYLQHMKHVVTLKCLSILQKSAFFCGCTTETANCRSDQILQQILNFTIRQAFRELSRCPVSPDRSIEELEELNTMRSIPRQTMLEKQFNGSRAEDHYLQPR